MADKIWSGETKVRDRTPIEPDVIHDVVYGDFVTFEITTMFKINAVHDLLPKSL